MTHPVVILTREEMLTRWRTLSGWDPLSCCAATAPSERIDSLIAAGIDAWYCNALLTADTSLLPHAEFADKAFATARPQDGCVTVVLPPECLRPVAVKLQGWTCAAQISPPGPDATLQLNPFSRADERSPVALLAEPDTLILYPATITAAGPVVETLLGVPSPSDGLYRLTPYLVSDMLKANISNLITNDYRLS